MEHEQFIDFGVAPYALADVCEALYKNGVTNAFLTLEDGDIHVRWKYDINRKSGNTVNGNNQADDDNGENTKEKF